MVAVDRQMVGEKLSGRVMERQVYGAGSKLPKTR